MKQFTSAAIESLNETEGVKSDEFIEFELDDRKIKAYQPTPQQLTFMLAALGRGQATDAKYASIINLMLSTLDDEDAAYMEGRLLERDPRRRLSMDLLEQIFEFLVSEWFARPTQPPSDSAPSESTTSTED